MNNIDLYKKKNTYKDNVLTFQYHTQRHALNPNAWYIIKYNNKIIFSNSYGKMGFSKREGYTAYELNDFDLRKQFIRRFFQDAYSAFKKYRGIYKTLIIEPKIKKHWLFAEPCKAFLHQTYLLNKFKIQYRKRLNFNKYILKNLNQEVTNEAEKQNKLKNLFTLFTLSSLKKIKKRYYKILPKYIHYLIDEILYDKNKKQSNIFQYYSFNRDRTYFSFKKLLSLKLSARNEYRLRKKWILKKNDKKTKRRYRYRRFSKYPKSYFLPDPIKK